MANILPLERQAHSVSAEFSYNAYERVWNGQDNPPFVTDEYSIRPFEPPQNGLVSSQQQSNTTWTFPTTRYSAYLECVVPTQEIRYNQTSKTLDRMFLQYDNGEKSCEYPLYKNISSIHVMYNLDRHFSNRYPHNAIFQDITPRQENLDALTLSDDPDGSRLKNTTKVCGVQDEFDFLAIWKNWPVTQEEVGANKPLSPRRVQEFLDNPWEIERTFPNGTTVPVTGNEKSDPALPLNHSQFRGLPPSPGTFTAVMCKPIYKQQAVEARVDNTLKVLSITKVIGDLLPLENINTTLFSNILTLRQNNFTEVLGLSPDAIPILSTSPAGIESFVVEGDPASNITLEDESSITIRDIRSGARHTSFTLFGMPDHSVQMRSAERFQTNVTAATKLLHQDKDLPFNALLTPPQSLLPFTLATANISNLEELGDPAKFIAALNSSYAMLFSYAMSNSSYFRADPDVSSASNAAEENISITRGGLVLATEVSVLFTRLTQAALALSALLALLLAFLTRRPLHTIEEPGSLFWHMKSIANCPELVRELDGVELLSPKEMETKFKSIDGRYYLNPEHGGIESVARDIDAESQPVLPEKADAPFIQDNKAPITTAPFELSLPLAIAVLVMITAAAAALGASEHIDKNQQGFLMDNAVVTKILLSYLPTIFGMLVEAFIVMVAKFVGMVEAYDDMHRGRTSLRALKINYENTPPAFLWFKALGNGHFLLAALSMSAVCANVLAVALSGLFQQETVQYIRTEVLDSPFTAAPGLNLSALEEYVNMPRLPVANETEWDLRGRRAPDDWNTSSPDVPRLLFDDLSRPYKKDPPNSLELIYATYHNFSSQGPLRSWTSLTTSFYPLEIGNLTYRGDGILPLREDAILRATTLGITNSLTCMAIPNSEVITGQPDDYATFSSNQWWYITPGRNGEPCTGAIRYRPWRDLNDVPDYMKDRYLYFDTIVPALRPQCLGNFMYTWHREGNYTPSRNESQLIVSCSPTMQLKNYTVSFDRAGNILSSAPLSSASSPALSELAPQQDLSLLHTLFQNYLGHARQYHYWQDSKYHLTPKPTLWFTRFLHDRFPTLADSYPPDPTTAITALQSVYPALFASFLSVYSKPLRTPSPETLPVTVIEPQIRWRVSFPLFLTSVIIMGLFFLVVLAVMWRRPGRFLVHLPSNIAATMVTIYAGRWIADLMLAGWKGGRRGVELGVDPSDAGGVRFGYGWFVGADGRWHIGVDKEPVKRFRLEKGSVGLLRR